MAHSLQYRPEIDGLRALAILPVIFFHAGFDWIAGGFLGVDVFFVISGYLITSIILKEHAQQRFRFIHFYERRARRILPALFFVLLSTLIIGWFVQSPLEYQHLTTSALAANVFVANLYFWHHIDYFTGDTALLPLLHLWSLGIEEQFYFLLPPLILWLWRPTSRLTIGLLSLFLLSLLSAHFLHQSAPRASFYWLHTRAWELLAGSLCALGLYKNWIPTHTALRQYGSLIGLLLLGSSFFLFSTQTPHPSLWTLIPVSGVACIILFATPNTYTAQFLSLRPLVGVGLFSYSAYLWHQPLFAFARLIRTQPELGIKSTLALIAITFIMAAISWHVIEQPFRNRQFLRTRTIFLLSLGGIIGFISFALWVHVQQGVPQRFHAVQQVIYQHQRQAKQQSAQPDPCFLDEHTPASELGAACRLQKKASWVVLGDSHAQHLAAGLTQQQQRPPLYTASGCAPIKNIDLRPWRPYCQGLVDMALADIAAHPPQLIILHANWLMYQDWIQHHAKDKTPIGIQLRDTVKYLQHIAPSSQIVVIGDVPQWHPTLIHLLTQHREPTASDYLLNAALPQLYAVEQQLKADLPIGVRFISLADMLCTEQRCLAVINTPNGSPAPMAWDYGHLTPEGAAHVGRLIQEKLKTP